MKSKTPYSLHVQEYVRFAMTDTVRYHPALPSLTAGDQVTADQLPHNKTFMVHVQWKEEGSEYSHNLHHAPRFKNKSFKQMDITKAQQMCHYFNRMVSMY